jgi:hypothetical protein
MLINCVPNISKTFKKKMNNFCISLLLFLVINVTTGCQSTPPEGESGKANKTIHKDSDESDQDKPVKDEFFNEDDNKEVQTVENQEVFQLGTNTISLTKTTEERMSFVLTLDPKKCQISDLIAELEKDKNGIYQGLAILSDASQPSVKMSVGLKGNVLTLSTDYKGGTCVINGNYVLKPKVEKKKK